MLSRLIRKSRQNRRAGFTLIELLVVVLIIGILLALAIPLYISSVRDAANKTVRSNIKAIATACQIYRVKHGVYPDGTTATYTTDGDMTNLDQNPANVTYTLVGTGATDCVITATESTTVFNGNAAGTIAYDMATNVWTEK